MRLVIGVMIALAAMAEPKLVRMGVKAEIPDSPEGRCARAWLRAFNSGNADTMAAFYRANLAASSREVPPLERRLEMYRHVHEEQGRLDLHRVVESKPGEIELLVRNRSGEWFEVVVHVETDPPHGLLGIRFEQSEGPQVGPAATGPPLTAAQLRDSIDRLVSDLAAADQFSGVVLLERGGRTAFSKGSGLAERTSKTPNTIDTKFNLGSINKLFTKLAIGRLVQEGKLALTDPVSKHLPELPAAIARVTIEQMIEHRSGLGDIFGPRYDGMDRSKLRAVKDWLPIFVDQPLQFEPGTDRRYSNAGYVLLGAIVERVSGQDYYEYVREHIYVPAGMVGSDSYESDRRVPNLAMGYTRGFAHGRPGGQALRDNRDSRPERGSPAGGGYSTAEDLVRFARALRENRLLDPAWTAWFMGGPAPQGNAVAVAGAGMQNRGGLGAAGGAPGINAALEIERDHTLVVLSNLDPPSAESVAATIRGWLRRTQW